jgi:hypothetical protein
MQDRNRIMKVSENKVKNRKQYWDEGQELQHNGERKTMK